jgi:hypothetical protein
MFGGSASAWSALPLVRFLTTPESMSTSSSSPVLNAPEIPGHTITGSAMLIALRKKIRAKL